MEVYKVGADSPKIKNNGGMHEFNLIKAVLTDIVCDDYVAVLNGVGNDSELLKLNKKIIFIATDAFCFTENKSLIQKSEVLLHQSMLDLSSIKNQNRFSGVPYLFCGSGESSEKNARIIFGGANTGRAKKFDKFLFESASGEYKEREFVKAYCKLYENGNVNSKVVRDDRIEYGLFLRELGKSKYSINFSRSLYDELAWMTPRYVESVFSGCLPMLDKSYVTCFSEEFDFLRVDSYEQMLGVRNAFTNDESRRAEVLSMLKKKLIENKYIFVNTVKDIIS